MKIQAGEPKFRPLVVTFETRFEIQVLMGLLTLVEINEDGYSNYTSLFGVLNGTIVVNPLTPNDKKHIKTMLTKLGRHVNKHVKRYLR